MSSSSSSSSERIQSTVEFIVIIVVVVVVFATAVANQRVLFGSLALEDKQQRATVLFLLGALVYFKSNYAPPRDKQRQQANRESLSKVGHVNSSPQKKQRLTKAPLELEWIVDWTEITRLESTVPSLVVGRRRSSVVRRKHRPALNSSRI